MPDFAAAAISRAQLWLQAHFVSKQALHGMQAECQALLERSLAARGRLNVKVQHARNEADSWNDRVKQAQKVVSCFDCCMLSLREHGQTVFKRRAYSKSCDRCSLMLLNSAETIARNTAGAQKDPSARHADC